jgi:hypothetical protein
MREARIVRRCSRDFLRCFGRPFLVRPCCTKRLACHKGGPMRRTFVSATMAFLLTSGISTSASACCWRTCSRCMPQSVSRLPRAHFLCGRPPRAATLSIQEVGPRHPNPAPTIPSVILSQLQPSDLPRSSTGAEWDRFNHAEVTWLARVDSHQPTEPTAMRVMFVSDDIVIDGHFTDLEHLTLAKSLRPGAIVVLRGIINMPNNKLALRLDACRIMGVQQW